MTDTLFTGERLHDDLPLFGLDLARHRAAYEFAAQRFAGVRVLDLGCGSGSGTALLARAGARAVGVDRVTPDAQSRAAGASFCRADIAGLPFRARRFDAVVSFQVIEHLVDPAPYLRAIGELLADRGTALLSTPNRGLSDGVNPFHVREYRSAELYEVLARHFAEVELLGIGTSEPVRAHLAARSRRIRRVMRLDPLQLRDRLPRAWVEALFALGARLVRRATARAEGTPDATWRDFPIGRADDATSLDWLVICRNPR
jgi:2-polyprenyl-3-methyl-5-hydroxy-6-metoxy-1,4-benzoquinol methylase